MEANVYVEALRHDSVDANVRVKALRQKANTLILSLLDHTNGRTTEETASAITELAFQDDNAVKELFAATTAPKDRARPSSPKPSLKSRSSRSILRLGRCPKRGSSEGKAAVATSSSETLQEKNDAGTVNEGRRTTPTTSLRSLSVPRRAKASASNQQYQCIFCDEVLSSKGVCKRHLEDQHVSPKQYKCEKCTKIYSVKAKAKEHANACGLGVFYFVTVKPEEKQTYACEFTGRLFQSMQLYLNSLLSLSERHGYRPSGDLHRKLYALLEQPKVRPYLEEASAKMLSSANAWQTISWNMVQLTKAIERLEYAVVHDNGTMDYSRYSRGRRTIDLRAYLCGLLCDRVESTDTMRNITTEDDTAVKAQSRSSSTSQGSGGTMTPRAVPISALHDEAYINAASSAAQSMAQNLPLPVTAANPDVAALQMSGDVKGKRHLSDHSRFYVPDRYPPGPPVPTMPLMYAAHQYNAGHITPTNMTSATLPFRPQDSHLMQQPHAQSFEPRHIYTPSLETSLTSDTATDSTLMTHYQEPELVAPMSFDYGAGWGGLNRNALPYSLPMHNQPTYQTAPADYYYHPSAGSTRAASVATDQTYVGEYNGLELKDVQYDPSAMAHPAQFGTSFLLDDDEFNDPNVLG
ncbi:uncharacterized protein LTR77_000409 [Saxophila tyrrhenica]|uniref:C2H2-type domain-containing protein n=1 Tax=Saxophila tyrrhenica TaxID=1690608 RepID=A0AAV9PR30_9PEZI|nr:hypothetical protein LTR77_000409 [Saxophila tyrrhenica]